VPNQPSASAGPDGLAVRAFRSPTEWKRWLLREHARTKAVWVRFFKKGTGIKSITYAEALDEALCYGWIDGQARRFDEQSYLQRFTPRRQRSPWSKINRDHVARLTREKRMQPAGLAEVDRAKKDGRWDAAYDSFGTASPPDDFNAALARNKKAKAFFATLSRQNVYAIYFRLHHAKKAETRAKRVAQFIEMLAQGRTIHPQAAKRGPRSPITDH
jgi:uncharacterized protein YdeI (YjbR/CyaY-like superfamily)